MRIETKMLVMLLPLMLIAVFSVLSINAHSIDSTGSESADQLIDASNGISPYVVDTRFPSSPQESRRLQGLNNPNSAAPGSSAGAQNSITQSEPAEPAAANQNTTANSENANETASAEMTSTVEATTVSGNWSFELNDSTNGSAPKEVLLALNESDHVILGYGNISEENNTQQVTASGSEDGNRLDLNLTTLETVNLYKLSLTRNGDSATGEYSAYSADGQSWTGSAKGIKSVGQI
jgi:hypothetical protein